MRSVHRRELLVCGAVILGGTRAMAQSSHWLVGTWQGSIVGMQGNAERTLVVRSVASDGVVVATWAGEVVSAEFRNDELKLTTGAGNPVQLTRGGDGNLAGFFTTNRGNGRRYSVVLSRRV